MKELNPSLIVTESAICLVQFRLKQLTNYIGLTFRVF